MNRLFYQPARQNFGFSQNMQQPQGGGQGFGGFGGGGGYGGFGYNPMFGGIGGLGFNPIMGPMFGMLMQGFGGFNPYQQHVQQMRQNQQFMEQRDQSLASTRQAVQQARQQNPAYAQLQQLQSQLGGKNPSFEQLQQIHDLQRQIENDPAVISATDAYSAADAYKNAAQQFQPQYGQQPELTFGTLGGTGEYDPKTGRVDLGTAGLAGGAPFTGPQRSAKDILSMAVGNMPQDMQYDLNKDGKITSADALAYRRKYEAQPQQPSNDPNRPPSGSLAPPQSPYSPPTSSDGKWVFSSGQWYPNSQDSIAQSPPAVPQRAQQTIADYRRQQPMFGGIGGLGFNPMMGPQFGMPLTPEQKYQQAQQFGTQEYLYANSPAGRMAAARYAMG